jgi:hypothetical protein
VTAGKLEGAKVYQGLGVGVSVGVGVAEFCWLFATSRVCSWVWVALWQLVSKNSMAINASQPRCRFGKVHAVFIGLITTKGCLLPYGFYYSMGRLNFGSQYFHLAFS